LLQVLKLGAENMVTLLIRKARLSKKKEFDFSSLRASEITAFCPHCKTIETLWFGDHKLMETRKFNQVNGLVYHDCGGSEPCKLYFGPRGTQD
jgi:hypothetical protein